jgi:hypothetical protein
MSWKNGRIGYQIFTGVSLARFSQQDYFKSGFGGNGKGRLTSAEAGSGVWFETGAASSFILGKRPIFAKG